MTYKTNFEFENLKIGDLIWLHPEEIYYLPYRVVSHMYYLGKYKVYDTHAIGSNGRLLEDTRFGLYESLFSRKLTVEEQFLFFMQA